jgi:hypothetical protein
VSLIQDAAELPVRFQVLYRGELARLYCDVGLSARQIARRVEASHSMVLAYLNRYGIEIRRDDLPDRRKGQVPFGWELREHRLVKDPIEQEIIRMMRQ